MEQHPSTPRCPQCGFTLFTNRYPKCETCGVALPAGLVLSKEELSAVLARERQDADDAARAAKRKAAAKPKSAGADSFTGVSQDFGGNDTGGCISGGGSDGC